MDLTDEFVDMCLKAKEIQEMWKPEEFDFIAVKYKKNVHSEKDVKIKIVNHISTGVFDVEDMKLRVGDAYHWIAWIPRQDQIQDMIGEYPHNIYNFYEHLTDPKDKNYDIDEGICKKIKSIEQIWLDYIMQSVFHKKWDGNDWEEMED